MGEFHAALDLGYSSNILQLCALRNNYFSERVFSKPLFLLYFPTTLSPKSCCPKTEQFCTSEIEIMNLASHLRLCLLKHIIAQDSDFALVTKVQK